MEIMRAVSRLFDRIVWLVYAISSLLMAMLVVLAGWQVWGRYIMNNSPTWTEQATLLALLYITLPLAAVGIRENFHLAVEIIPDMLGQKALLWQERFVLLCLGFFGFVMMTAGYELTSKTWAQTLPLIGVSRGFTYLPLLISGVMTLAFVAEKLVWSVLNPHAKHHPHAPSNL